RGEIPRAYSIARPEVRFIYKHSGASPKDPVCWLWLSKSTPGAKSSAGRAGRPSHSDYDIGKVETCETVPHRPKAVQHRLWPVTGVSTSAGNVRVGPPSELRASRAKGDGRLLSSPNVVRRPTDPHPARSAPSFGFAQDGLFSLRER